MRGNNTLELCPAEMYEALQWYLNSKVLTAEHQVRVENIRWIGSGSTGTFILDLAPLEVVS